jgi:hypothetical protein
MVVSILPSDVLVRCWVKRKLVTGKLHSPLLFSLLLSPLQDTSLNTDAEHSWEVGLPQLLNFLNSLTTTVSFSICWASTVSFSISGDWS